MDWWASQPDSPAGRVSAPEPEAEAEPEPEPEEEVGPEPEPEPEPEKEAHKHLLQYLATAMLENHSAAIQVVALCTALHHATQQALGALSRKEIVRRVVALYVRHFRCFLIGERRSITF